jgi:hypothetical protein
VESSLQCLADHFVVALAVGSLISNPGFIDRDPVFELTGSGGSPRMGKTNVCACRRAWFLVWWVRLQKLFIGAASLDELDHSNQLTCVIDKRC